MGFDVLDTVAHTLLTLDVDAAGVRVVQLSDIPNANWLRPSTVSRNQQKFGDDLSDRRPLVVAPSVVSTRSGNLLIGVDGAAPAHSALIPASLTTLFHFASSALI